MTIENKPVLEVSMTFRAHEDEKGGIYTTGVTGINNREDITEAEYLMLLGFKNGMGGAFKAVAEAILERREKVKQYAESLVRIG